MRKISVGVIAVLALAFGIMTIAEAAINEGFDNFQSGSRPRGWTFAYCGQNSDANTLTFGVALPSVTMDAYGDQITSIQFNQSSAGTITFWAEALAENPSSALWVREYDGTDWNIVTMMYGLPTTGENFGPLDLNPSGSQQVDFTYKDPDNNTNIFLDDVVITNAATPAPTAAPVLAPTPVHLVADWDDYDGDGASDIATYDPTTGEWDIDGVTVFTANFGGGANDIPAPGDYDGDGVADQAYFNRAIGLWFAQDVATGASILGGLGTSWGQVGDLPVPGDYDGNGTADLGTWRPSDGRWRIKDITNVWYGQADGMYPVPGDYNGDGTTDIAMYYPTTGIWYVKDVANRYWGTGAAGFAKPMDYDGDGTTDIAIYQTTSRWWYIRNLVGAANVNYKYWGIASDMPAIGDFDGDGLADLTQFRPSTNTWWILYSGGPYGSVSFPASSSDVIVDGATGY